MRIISGQYKGFNLITPKGLITRPTSSRVRGAVFNILQNEIEGARFLDLFAGSGAMGLEAISRGASHAAFVDHNRDAARSIEENISRMGVKDQATLLYGDCLAQLTRLEQLESPYTIIYVDPPYDQGLGKLVLEAIDRSSILAPGGVVFVEESPKFEIPDLHSLAFQKKRNSGRSNLYQFAKNP